MKTPYEKRRSVRIEYRCQRCGEWFEPKNKPRPGRQGRCGHCKNRGWWFPRAIKQETPQCQT